MSKLAIAAIMMAATLTFIVIRVPIGAAMFVAGAAGYWAMVGDTALLNFLKGLLWSNLANYDLSVIPLFLLMGELATSAGFSRSLFRAANTLVGHLKGGIAMSSILACATFGAICGSSVATTATVARIALPQMRELNYSDRLSTGTLAVGGTLGILIPPSIILVIYAILAEQSIAKLFAAAMIPGVLAISGYCIVIAVMVRIYPDQAPIAPRVSNRERLKAIADAWPIVAIFLVMFVGIYGGFFTPTEGASVAVAATLLLGIARKRLTWRSIVKSILPVVQSSAMIFLILLGAGMLNAALAISQVPASAALWAQELQVNPILIVGGFLLIFALLTCVLDELAMMLLLLPILLPIVIDLDLYNLTSEQKAIWFGILMLSVVAFGLLAPPIGLNVYVVRTVAHNVPVWDIYRGIIPFLFWDILRIVLLLAFPALTLIALQIVR
jgi:tripartite ATP-independent transporter DctM subunit